ncbi:diguanylate cyclase [Desulfurivibrio dismutans]|uniref:diguanylate cyclase n=1 Tax=Desulfurivibrio dismutans TaxID=1398908 RepID=UPI0023DA0EB4|nr:diguanylate cyclase [Desulfurivibrio alkaliphilus]MDF1615765.1 diguanylate cyclase [Desulfurivibrio alkaliphilus]
MFVIKRPSIKEEIFFWGAIFSFITLVVFGLLYFSSLAATNVDKAKKSLQETNTRVGIVTDSLFKEMRFTVDTLTAIPQVAHITSANSPQAARALLIYEKITQANEDIGYLYSGYEDGSLLINDYTPPEGFYAPARPWYIAAIAKKPEQSFGLPYREAKTNEWLISQSKALTDTTGRITGVVSIDVSLARINNLLAENKEYSSQRTFLLDREGKLIIHPDEELIGHELPHITNQIKDRRGEGEFLYTENGDTRWAFFTPLEPVGWTVVTTVKRSEVIAPILITTFYYTLGVALVALILGGLQSRYLGKRLAEPLTRLGKRIAEIVEGRPKTGFEYNQSNHEIATIANHIEELTERALQRKANELQTILESSRDGILVTDNHGRVTYANSHYKEMWHLPLEPPLKADVHHLATMIAGQIAEPESFFARAKALNSSLNEDTDKLNLNDGRVFEWFSCPVMDEANMLEGRLWNFRDITTRKRAEESLFRMATTDHLTELYNRQYFEAELAQALSRTQRYSSKISLVMFDVDHFKAVNDTYGHDAGDRVLYELGRRATATLRGPDTLARWGGEEFVVIMPETIATEAGQMAERLRLKTAGKPFPGVGSITISLGVTSIHPSDNSNTVLKRLDNALYEAKRSGRNRVEVVGAHAPSISEP